MKMITRITDFYDGLHQKKNYKLVASLPWVFGCLVFLLILYKHGQVRYESNDDLFLSFIVSGTYGKYYHYNMFNSYPLSMLFSVLYSITGALNWTFLYYYGFIVLSYLVFGVWNICRNRLVPAYLTNLLFVVATYNALITRMNFSKSAAVIIAMGYILFATSATAEDRKSKGNVLLRVLSYAFIVGGFLIRWDTCLASLPFLAVLMAYVFFHNGKKLRSLVPFAGILAAFVLIWGADYIAYHADPDWRYWTEYNTQRAALLDYYMPPYELHQDQYEEIGISQNDYEALDSWIYADDQVFDMETLRQIVAIREPGYSKYFELNRENLEAAILNCLTLFKGNSIIYVVLFLLLLLVPLLQGADLTTVVLTFLISFGEIFYLIFGQRCPERALFLPVMMLFMVLLFFMGKASAKREGIISLMTVFILIFSFYGSNFYYIDREEGFQYRNREETIGMLEELSTRGSNLYVWDGHERDLLRYVYSPKEVPEFGIEKNFVMLGGWSVPSPVMSDRTEAFGEKYNTLKLLAENENVYYITGTGESLGIIEQYIREHYNPNVQAELVENVHGYQVYSFVSGGTSEAGE